MPIKTNQSILPFFGARLDFIRGLDPLGLQNTSDATFSKLLPGLNNVTGRIRYYSFYCWLLELYSSENGSTNPKEQQRFIRRAEYLIALSSRYVPGENSGIPGSNYASQELGKRDSTVHSLEEGTFKSDGFTTRDTYWNYKLGAFGQYYLGSLRDIGLIIERENHSKLYVRTNRRTEDFVSGQDLAEAFDENIPAPQKALFLSLLKNGIVTKEQLEHNLTALNLAQIPPESKERHLLTELLSQKDFPLKIEENPFTMRRQTIYYLLDYVQNERGYFSDRAFVNYCYIHQGKAADETNECLMGWYYYQFNEYWQYANTAILNGTLDYLNELKGPKWMALPELIEDLTQQTLELLYEDFQFPANTPVMVQDVLDNINIDLLEQEVVEEIKTAQQQHRINASFFLLFKVFQNNQSKLLNLKTYAEKHEMTREGEGTAYFINQFAGKLDIDLSKFIQDYLYKNIIYRHQYVAFRKMGGGKQSTQKFIIEGQLIRYLGNFNPNFTGPRIVRLISFLKDLHIIDDENLLTPKGTTLLKKLHHGENH